MKKITTLVKNAWTWLCENKDFAHVIGGAVSGLIFGFGGAICLAIGCELKDIQWGGKASWCDLLLTISGGVVGGAINLLVWLNLIGL